MLGGRQGQGELTLSPIYNYFTKESPKKISKKIRLEKLASNISDQEGQGEEGGWDQFMTIWLSIKLLQLQWAVVE